MIWKTEIVPPKYFLYILRNDKQARQYDALLALWKGLYSAEKSSAYLVTKWMECLHTFTLGHKYQWERGAT